MLPAEQSAVIALASCFPPTKELGYIWRHWENWERYPPIVAVEGAELAAFHALTWSRKSHYANSYYLGVAEQHQGKGLAGATVAFMLPFFKNLGIARLKMRCKPGSPGERFWKGFGLVPWGKLGKDLLFDTDLGGCVTIEEWVAWNKKPSAHQPPPPSAQARYRKAKIQLFANRKW